MRRSHFLIFALSFAFTNSAAFGESVAPQTFLETRETFDGGDNLWYIPNEQIESGKHPTVYAFEENLLMTTNDYVSDGKSELTLTLLNMETGETMQSVKLESSGATEVQLFAETIAVCDSSTGNVIVLDDTLGEIAQYNLTPQGDQWFLGSDLDTLYECSYLDGIHGISLSTSEEKFFLDMADLSVRSETDRGLCFTGIDRSTEKYGAFYLDFSDGTVTNPPFLEDFFQLYHSGDMWLGGLYGEENTFIFGTDENPWVVTTQDGIFSLVDPLGQLLFTGFDGTLSLYDSNGSFLSSCSLPGLYVQNLIWCESQDGYLLLANDNEDNSRLLFWDCNENTNGEDLQTQSFSDYHAVPGGTSADTSLYDRAKELSNRFDIEIRIADQCETEFAYFSGYQVSDYGPLSSALDTLEGALSVFPEDFFSQLLYGHVDSIQFQLIGGLVATNGFGGDINYAGFTETNGSVCKIILDVYSLNANSFWHEFSHVIDKRLAWDAMYRSKALFSEDRWRSYNPDNFSYSEEYDSLHNEVQPEWYDYFVDNYAMINATEDRARIFECAIENVGTLFQSEGLKTKLQYYSDCIRDCFDTTLWPETTAWEVPLK